MGHGMKKGRFGGDKGVTLIELMMCLLILGIVATLGLQYLLQTRDRAFEAVIAHDLKEFKKAQMVYQSENTSFLGAVGESTRSDGTAPDFTLEMFTPSRGVRITILSTPDPFIVEASHKSLNTVIEYNVLTEERTER